MAVLLTLGAGAQAKPKFLPILKSTFNIPVGSDADQAGCKNCHTSPPERNVFGKAIDKALTDANADDLTPAILNSIDKLDSDGDGFTNGEELRAGFLPGDPASHPTAHAAPTPASGTPASAPTGLAALIPNHTFHPAVVHFPIALFLFGVALELLAMWKRDDQLRNAAYWNFLGAALSLLIVIPTGLIASFRQGFSLSWGQPVFTHFLLASAAALGIIFTAIWQKRNRPVGAGYWILLVVTAVLVGAAGHYGGNLIY